jgi:hypothetical protein
MRAYDLVKYPHLAALDKIVGDFLSSEKSKEMSTVKREQHICSIHPIYWMESYGWIEEGLAEEKDSEAVEVAIIRFKLNPVQLYAADRLCAKLVPGRWKRVKAVVEKNRKAGISTLMAAFDYWFMRHMKNCGVFVIADKSAHTTNIYRMIERFYQNDALPGKPDRVPMPKNKTGLHFDNGAMLELDSGETRQPGTSQTIQILHMSENAKWAQIVDAEVSILNSIPRKGFAWQIKESTAWGLNKFADDCLAALDKKSDWDLIFIPWYDLEDCSVPLDEGETLKLTQEELELKENYSLTDEQIKFRREKISDLGGTDKFKQDFPMHAREPFYTSQTTFFNVVLLEERKEEIEFYRIFREYGLDSAMSQFPVLASQIKDRKRNPKGASDYIRKLSDQNILPRKISLSVLDDGKVTFQIVEEPKEYDPYFLLWRDPLKNRKYVVSVDPAEGIMTDGYTSDLSVIEVIEASSREQVAEFAGVFDEEVTAKNAVLIAKLFNEALLVVEINNACGALVLQNVLEAKYRRLYRTQKTDRHQRYSADPGWKTTKSNKHEVCGRLRQDFKRDDCIIYSVALLIEMMNFVEDRGKLQAAPKHTDDRVMSFSIGLEVINKTPALQSMSYSERLRLIRQSIPSGAVERDFSWPLDKQPLGEEIFAGPSMKRGRKVVRLGRRIR